MRETAAEYVTDATLALCYAALFLTTRTLWLKHQKKTPPIKKLFWFLIMLNCILRVIWFAVPDSVFGASYRPQNTEMDGPTSTISSERKFTLFMEFFLKTFPDVIFFSAYLLILGFWASSFSLYWRTSATLQSPSSLQSSSAVRFVMIANILVYVCISTLYVIFFIADYYHVLMLLSAFTATYSALAVIGFIVYGLSLIASLTPLLDSNTQPVITDWPTYHSTSTWTRDWTDLDADSHSHSHSHSSHPDDSPLHPLYDADSPSPHIHVRPSTHIMYSASHPHLTQLNTPEAVGTGSLMGSALHTIVQQEQDLMDDQPTSTSATTATFPFLSSSADPPSSSLSPSLPSTSTDMTLSPLMSPISSPSYIAPATDLSSISFIYHHPPILAPQIQPPPQPLPPPPPQPIPAVTHIPKRTKSVISPYPHTPPARLPSDRTEQRKKRRRSAHHLTHHHNPRQMSMSSTRSIRIHKDEGDEEGPQPPSSSSDHKDSSSDTEDETSSVHIPTSIPSTRQATSTSTSISTSTSTTSATSVLADDIPDLMRPTRTSTSNPTQRLVKEIEREVHEILDGISDSTDERERVWEEYVHARLRAIQMVTITCVLAFTVKLIINMYQFRLSSSSSWRHTSSFPHHWWLIVALYHFLGEVMCSFIVIWILRKPVHTREMRSWL